MGNSNYTVVIKTSLDSRALKTNSREVSSVLDKIAQDAERAAKREFDAIQKLHGQKMRMAEQEFRDIQRIHSQKTQMAEREVATRAKAEQQAASQSARIQQQELREVQRIHAEKGRMAEREVAQRVRAEQQAAREIQRINAQTARQAVEQERVRERLHKEFADQRQRLIKREQDAFIRAETEKTAAARAAGAAQVRSMEATKAAMIAAWGMIKAVVVAVFAGIVVAAGGLGLAISRAMSFDVLERGLEIVAGTAEEAQRQLVRLKELARLPGLGLREAITGSIALQIGFQSSIKNTTTRMQLAETVIKQFSNAIALTGGGPEIFQRVITQLTQMSNAGKVLMTDLRPIIQAAPAIGQALVKAFGTIDPKEINELGLTTEQFMSRLNAALATLPRATDSAANAWTNFTNAFDMALVAIGKPFLDPLTKGLALLEPLLSSLGDQIAALFTKLGQDAVTLWANLPDATRKAFENMLSTVMGLGNQIVDWFKGNYALILSVVTNVLNQIAIFWTAHGDRIRQVVSLQLANALEVVQSILQILAGDWKSAWESLATVVKTEGKVVYAAVVWLVRMAFNAVLAQKDLLKAAGIGLGEALVDGVVSGLKGKAGRLLSTVIDVVAPVVPLVRNLWQSRSPSLVFMRIGGDLIEGLIIGMKDKASTLREEVRGLVLDVTETAALGFSTRDRQVGTKSDDQARGRIAEALQKHITALRELSGQNTAVAAMNRMLSDPAVARNINERTAALLRQAAAMEDTLGQTRPRLAIGGLTRPRRIGEEATRARTVGIPDEAELEVGRFYGDLLDELGGKLERHAHLTQVQITLQRLERAGLTDLTDARAQELLALAAQIDRETELVKTRNLIAGFADSVSVIFGRAVDQWDGSFKNFFSSVKQGFGDMLRSMIADFLQSAIYSRLRNFLEGLFKVGVGQTGGGGSGGVLGSLGGVFGGGGGGSTGGFSGGSGASGILGSVMGMGGGISVPGSASSPAGLAGIAQGLSGGLPGGAASGGGSAAAAASGGLGSLLPALMGPMIGATLGAGLGGRSGVGSILGGVGGGILGLYGGITALAATGAISGGSALAGLLPIMAGAAPFLIPIAAALLIGSVIMARNAQRRADETQRNEWGGSALEQVYQVLWAAQRGDLTVTQARTEWDKIHSAYMAQVRTLKDDKTRRHATLWWDNDVTPIWAKIEAAAKAGEQAKDFTSSFVPTFAGGGVFIPKAANGLMGIPGMFDRKDDILMRVSRGEHVAVMNPDQFNRIGGTRTFQAAGVPALANGGVSTGAGSQSALPPIVIHSTTYIDAKGMVKQVMRSNDGRRIIAGQVKVEIEKEGSEGLLGDIELGLLRR